MPIGGASETGPDRQNWPRAPILPPPISLLPARSPCVLYRVASRPACMCRSVVSPPPPPLYSYEEVARHCTQEDCWVVIDKQVYDITRLLPDHPDEELMLLCRAGKDATAEFKAVHFMDVLGKPMSDFFVGHVIPVDEQPTSASFDVGFLGKARAVRTIGCFDFVSLFLTVQ